MPENHRLLVIDDEKGILSVLRDLGKRAGYEVFATDDPEVFLARTLQWSPSFILMDLQMPQIDGVELLRRLAFEKVSAPIALMSGVDDKLLRTVGDLGTDLGLNMRGVLGKPIRAETFLRTLEEFAVPSADRDLDDLRLAIERKEMVLYYQPIMQLRSRNLIAVEALVRWNNPRKGLVFPDQFIPLAEEKGLMDDLTWLVLGEAIAQAGRWLRGNFPLPISINLSASNLHDPAFPDKIETLCREHDVPPERIWLELTETATSSDATSLKAILSRIRLKQFRLAIDDFGTGYSSMKQLRLLPFSELKIDMSFVHDMLRSEDASIIVDAVLALAGAFRMAVIAEGIETESQLATLIKRGCLLGQGYLFAKALPPAELEHAFFDGRVPGDE
jgi:EAL domain-containing protein (putative c-di-GMP-specific phosphodiesterase class I)